MTGTKPAATKKTAPWNTAKMRKNTADFVTGFTGERPDNIDSESSERKYSAQEEKEYQARKSEAAEEQKARAAKAKKANDEFKKTKTQRAPRAVASEPTDVDPLLQQTAALSAPTPSPSPKPKPKPKAPLAPSALEMGHTKSNFEDLD